MIANHTQDHLRNFRHNLRNQRYLVGFTKTPIDGLSDLIAQLDMQHPLHLAAQRMPLCILQPTLHHPHKNLVEALYSF